MTATARQIPVSKSDLDGSGGGAYAELEVPGDYEAVLTDVKDYDKRAAGKSWGWIFTYSVETPSGGNVTFDNYLSFGENARWKLIQVFEAHQADLTEGLNEVDPNSLVGETVGAHIDFPRHDETDEPTSKFREIIQFFSLAAEPEEEVAGGAAIAAAVGASGIEDVVKFGEEPQAEEPAVI